MGRPSNKTHPLRSSSTPTKTAHGCTLRRRNGRRPPRTTWLTTPHNRPTRGQPTTFFNTGLRREPPSLAQGESPMRMKSFNKIPNDTRAQNNLGNIAWKQKRNAVAADHFEKAINLDEKNTTALRNLGAVRQELKQYARCAKGVPQLPRPRAECGYRVQKYRRKFGRISQARPDPGAGARSRSLKLNRSRSRSLKLSWSRSPKRR